MSDRYDDRGRYDDLDRRDDRDRGRNDRDRYDDRDRDRDRYDDRDRDRYDDRDRFEEPAEKKSKKALWFALGGAALVLALVAGVLVTGVLGGSKDEAASGEILLEPTSFSGETPFSATPLSTEPTSTPCAPGAATTTSGAQPAAACTPTATPPPPTSAGGGKPGLYGGTGEKNRCDPDQLVKFLAENPAKAKAWVDALNRDPALNWDRGQLTVADIPLYVAELTSVVLTQDTRVTNHGFVGGKANAIQSVLQKGSAVLVDKYGVPRVKCYCGNPLLPSNGSVGTKYKGVAWQGFDPSKVNVVAPSPKKLTGFEVVGPDGKLTKIQVGINVNVNVNVNTSTTAPTSSTPATTGSTPATAATVPQTTPQTVPDTAPPTVPDTTAPTVPATTPPTTAAPAAQCSPESSTPATVKVVNTSSAPINLSWYDQSCNLVGYGSIGPGETREQPTFTTHKWLIQGANGPVQFTVGASGETITY
jgi:hypothetical protein